MKLIDLPDEFINFPRLERRLPRKKIKNITGYTINGHYVIGYAGIIDLNVVWYCICDCGFKNLMSLNEMKRHSCRRCRAKKLNWGWSSLV